MPSIPAYQYAQRGKDVFVNLYIGGEAVFSLGEREVKLTQETRYPWDGRVSIKIGADEDTEFALKLRIPGWSQNQPVPSDLYQFMDKNSDPVTIKVNDIASEVEVVDGYATINRTWKMGDEISLYFPMPVRRLLAHPEVKEDQYKVALQRGPMVYCLEGQDQPDERVINMLMDINAPVRSSFKDTLLGGIQTINFKGSLYQKTKPAGVLQQSPLSLQAIPYYAWANRGLDYMTVWIPYDEKGVSPAPAPTLANTSIKKASAGFKGNLNALADQYQPKNASDQSNQILHWWPRFGQEEWVQYEFERPKKVQKVRVYWFDDGPDGGCRVPASWTLYYKEKGAWKTVDTEAVYTISKGAFDVLSFEQVETSGLKIVLQAQAGVSAGLIEWEVE